MVAAALRPVVCSMRGDAAVKAMSHELPRALLDVGRERRAASGGRCQASLAGQQAASPSYRHLNDGRLAPFTWSPDGV